MGNEYGIARGLKGFRNAAGGLDTELRVRIERRDERAGLVWVRTADLRSSGVRLVLDAAQVTPEVEEQTSGAVRHASGLVWIGGGS